MIVGVNGEESGDWTTEEAAQSIRGPAGSDVTVHVRVLQPGAQAVTIDYAMEKTASGWKVYDVMVGGVSLVANYRTEFTTAIRESGVDGLIKTLHAKNGSLAAAAPEKK